jgi:hypothetical protein
MANVTRRESSTDGGDPIFILHSAARYLCGQGKNANEDDDIDLLQQNASQVLKGL